MLLVCRIYLGEDQAIHYVNTAALNNALCRTLFTSVLCSNETKSSCPPDSQHTTAGVYDDPDHPRNPVSPQKEAHPQGHRYKELHVSGHTHKTLVVIKIYLNIKRNNILLFLRHSSYYLI